MGFSFRHWVRNALGGGIQEVDCQALFEAAAEDYRIRELAFWTCVNLISNALARCEFRTYEGGKETRGMVYYLWNVQPNANQNSTVFLHKLIAKLYQDNEALIVPSPNVSLHLKENEMLNLFVADDWTDDLPEEYPDRPNKYSGITVGNVPYKKTLLEPDVFHLTLHHCDIQPVIKGIYNSYVKLVSAAMQNYAWTNGQHWKVHVNQVASGQEGWEERFQKMLEKQIKPFLTSGSSVLPELDGYVYENTSKAIESGRDGSHIRALVNDIFDFTANAFLIPPVLLRGQVEGTKDAVQRFLTNCIDPLADQVGEEFTRKAYGFEGWKKGNFLRVDTSAIQHFNIFENAANVEKLIGSGYSYNDVQRATGGQEIDEPWAYQHFLTKNFDLAQNILGGNTEGKNTKGEDTKLNGILKSATIAKQEIGPDDLALINKQTLRELTLDEVFVFRLAACDNQIDRDFERFTDAALSGLAPMFVGKSVLMDHTWLAGSQTARVYDAYVQPEGDVKRLILCCYMPRTDGNANTINDIETGILRECSVGCQVERVSCSICGADQVKACCAHIAGREYDGKLCFMELDGAKDAYEVSLVAVPTQKEAGVLKGIRYGGKEEPDPEPVEPSSSIMQLLGRIFE